MNMYIGERGYTMDQQQLEAVVGGIAEASLIEGNHIPDIDLYMDQILTFLDERLKDFKRQEADKTLTKTMINNYSKDRVLSPPVNKKYSRHHMMLFILIYHMKSMLTISDISKVIQAIEQGGAIDSARFYESFLALQKIEQASLWPDTQEKLEQVTGLQPSSGPEEDILMILSLLIDADMKKRLAEKMIDAL